MLLLIVATAYRGARAPRQSRNFPAVFSAFAVRDIIRATWSVGDLFEAASTACGGQCAAPRLGCLRGRGRPAQVAVRCGQKSQDTGIRQLQGHLFADGWATLKVAAGR